jgi:hypothetical protein
MAKRPASRRPTSKRPAKRTGLEDFSPFAGETPWVSAEEASAAFDAGDATDTLKLFESQVLRVWNYTCAVTGQRYSPGPTPHPELTVTFIQPLSEEGLLHVSNVLPLVPGAARALMDQRIIIGNDFEVWAGLSWIGSDILGRIVPLGRLWLPDDQGYWPARRFLEWHRRRALGGN